MKWFLKKITQSKIFIKEKEIQFFLNQRRPGSSKFVTQRKEKDKVKILKLNIDENPGIPQKYFVRGIPTLMLFKEGKLIDTKVGSLSKSALIEWIDSNL